MDPKKEWTIINGQNMELTDFNVRMKRRSDLGKIEDAQSGIMLS